MTSQVSLRHVAALLQVDGQISTVALHSPEPHSDGRKVTSAGLDLSDKPVAVFGLGDSVSYGEYFCDAMEEVYRYAPCSASEAILHLLCGGVSGHVLLCVRELWHADMHAFCCQTLQESWSKDGGTLACR